MVDERPVVTERKLNTSTGIKLADQERRSRAAWEQFLPEVQRDLLIATYNQLVWMLENPEKWVPYSLTEAERLVHTTSAQFTISFHVDVTTATGDFTKASFAEATWLEGELTRLRDHLAAE